MPQLRMKALEEYLLLSKRLGKITIDKRLIEEILNLGKDLIILTKGILTLQVMQKQVLIIQESNLDISTVI